MALWKQLIISLVLLAAATGLWARFFPGAPEILARLGIDWIPVATATTQPDGAERRQRRGGFSTQQSVIAEPVVTATINDRLTAIGTGRAARSVVVTPFAAGRLKEVPVDSGTTVEAGSVIAMLDSDGEEIAVDRARISLDDAKSRLERVNALRSTNTVTAVQVTEAQLAVRNAELALRDAQLALQRRSIIAPISGVIGIVPVSAGNYVTAQTEIVTIDDRSEILVDFWVPERFAGVIEVGAPLEAISVARPDEVYSGTISAVDNRVDAESRTLRLQAKIDNPSDTLRAGMSFRVVMRFSGDIYPAVSPLAIQWGTDGAYVWSVEEGRGKRVLVRIIQRNTDSVLVDADIEPGTLVVTEGVHSVREGAPVLIADETPPAISEAEPASPRMAPSGT